MAGGKALAGPIGSPTGAVGEACRVARLPVGAAAASCGGGWATGAGAPSVPALGEGGG